MDFTYPREFEVIELASCESTNSYVKSRYEELKERLPVLVTAGCQTGGRGRSNRTWVSTAGLGLYSSFGLSLEIGTPLQFLPLAAGIAVIETLKGISDESFDLKWPNDILYKGKKIAGILIENIIQETHIFSVVGIGINLNHQLEDFPEELREKGISLKMITGFDFDMETINMGLAYLFLSNLYLLKGRSGNAIVNRANSYSHSFMGREIRFHSGDKIINGIFRCINSDGGLILEREAEPDEPILFYSGEIL